VNQAFQFLNRPLSPAEVVTRLAAQLGVSTRQAARYVRAAQKQSVPWSIPEAKDVFTVKLPKSLIRRVRQMACAQDQPISDWVARALEEQLRGVPRHG
jgi:predicted HicB family RNase H-like nuclease